MCACWVVYESSNDSVSVLLRRFSCIFLTLISIVPAFSVIVTMTALKNDSYYQGYETVCLLLGVLCVAAVLQGGTTNWLVGVFFVGVYLMIAAGFWYHEDEDLSE